MKLLKETDLKLKDIELYMYVNSDDSNDLERVQKVLDLPLDECIEYLKDDYIDCEVPYVCTFFYHEPLNREVVYHISKKNQEIINVEIREKSEEDNIGEMNIPFDRSIFDSELSLAQSMYKTLICFENNRLPDSQEDNPSDLEELLICISSLTQKGYSFSMKKSDEKIWGLWDSNQIVMCKGILYNPNNIITDNIYFICDLFDAEDPEVINKNIQDEFSGKKYFKRYNNCILETRLNSFELKNDCYLKIAHDLYDKIKKGIPLSLNDLLGNIIRADSPYEFYFIGEEKVVVETDEDSPEEDIEKLYTNNYL